MDPEIWSALIAASVGVAAAVMAYLAGERARTTEQAASRAELDATRANLERQLSQQKAQLQEEHRHEMERVLLESRNEYDLELLRRRLDEYQRLFAVLKPLSMDGRPRPSEDEGRSLVTALTDWYTDRGGLLLSAESRDALFKLRRQLRGLDDSADETARLKAEFPPRAAASRLRSQLTKDVLTRRQAFDRDASTS